jgi:hypothetical protein
MYDFLTSLLFSLLLLIQLQDFSLIPFILIEMIQFKSMKLCIMVHVELFAQLSFDEPMKHSIINVPETLKHYPCEFPEEVLSWLTCCKGSSSGSDA